MIMSQYRVSKEFPVTYQALQKQAKQVPRPRFFKDMPGYDAPCVDTSHKDFKRYIKSVEDKKNRVPQRKGSNKELMRLIDVMGTVLDREYGEEESNRVKMLIIGELEN